jgi:peptidoglycan/xylan/chitin deacetylase (PgdA/CDA1 family)
MISPDPILIESRETKGMPVITLGFHDVVESFTTEPLVDLVYTVDRLTFRAHLDAISAGQKATPGGSGQLVYRSKVLLTFDDGRAGCYRCAIPELETQHLRGHFFIITSCIGRPGYLDRTQISEMHRRGHVIGSHSVSHPERMSHLGWDALVKEWSQSCDLLANIVGEPVTVASVPGGYTSETVCRAAAACGIRILFTSEPTASVSTIDGCLVLGRYSIRRWTRPAAAGAIASGARAPRYRESALWMVKKGVKYLAGDWYVRGRQALIDRTLRRAATRIGE